MKNIPHQTPTTQSTIIHAKLSFQDYYNSTNQVSTNNKLKFPPEFLNNFLNKSFL